MRTRELPGSFIVRGRMCFLGAGRDLGPACAEAWAGRMQNSGSEKVRVFKCFPTQGSEKVRIRRKNTTLELRIGVLENRIDIFATM